MAAPTDGDDEGALRGDDAEASDRRGEGRAAIRLKVDYKRLNTFFADYTKNISKGGTFIRTTKPLDVGTELVFVLTAPEPGGEDGAIHLELVGQVKWTVPEPTATDESPAGMGIQFVFETEEERARVQRFVSDRMRSSLGERLADKLLSRS